MYLKNKFVSLFMVLSVLVLGMIMSCKDPVNPQNDNEETQNTQTTPSDDPEFTTAIESTDQGIKISWKDSKIPANTTSIIVESWADGLFYLDLFEINDMSIKEVVDEYVTQDKRYQYRICCYDSNLKELKRYYTGSIATGGKGELQVNTAVTENGINLTANKNSDAPNYWIFRKATDTPEDEFWTYDRFDLTSHTDLNFTDKLVNSNKEYRYYVHEQIGNRTQIDGDGHKTIGDPLVKWPRFEIKTITTTGGSGELSITQQPVITYSEENNTLSITQLPEFTLNPNYCIDFYFKNSENRTFWAGNYDSQYSTRTSWTLNNAIPGEWQFDYCYAHFYFDNFEYFYDFDAEDLPNIPAITIPESTQPDDPPEPTPTPVDFSVTKHKDGIQLEWGEMPEGVSKVILRLEHDNSTKDIFITDLTKTSFIDKYVTPGTTYNCGIMATDNNWNFISLYSNNVSITPENGLGEAKITNKPAATWSSQDPDFVTFTTKPQVSVFSDLNLNYNCTFYYTKQGTDNKQLLYTVWTHESNVVSFMGDSENGTWTLRNYKIEFNAESYSFQQYNYEDLSNLTDIPQTITLSE